ncbi:UNVERIFIED_CONTAM: hypothetical protein K2H54_000136 [Gekko kuhli]
MSIDIDNLTGTESLEELEAALNTLEEGSDTTLQPQVDATTQSEEKDVSTAPSAAKEEGSNTTDEDGQADGSDEEPEKVILSKDGKHHIPYDVLEAERAQRQALAAENAQLKAVAAEREKLQQVLDKHGIDPDADPDALNIEEIEQLAQDYPEIGKVLTGIANRLNTLAQSARQQPVQSQPPPSRTIVDERLKADPAWKDKPLTARFAEVAKRTKAAFGDPVEQQVPPAEKPAPQKQVEERIMTQVTSAQANKILQVALFTEANRAHSLVNMLTEEAPKGVKINGGKQTSHGAPVVRVTDLTKKRG